MTGPVEVATKKFTTEPLVKPVPLMLKLEPTSIIGETLEIVGWPGAGVAVAVGVRVRVGIGVRVGVGVGVRVGVGVGVAPPANLLAKVLMSTVPHPVVRSKPTPALKPVTPLKLLLPVVTSRKPDAASPALANE